MFIIEEVHRDEDAIMESLLVGVKWRKNRFTSPIRLDSEPDCYLFRVGNKPKIYDPVLDKVMNCYDLYSFIYNVSINQAFIDAPKTINRTRVYNPIKYKTLEHCVDISIEEYWTNEGLSYIKTLGLNVSDLDNVIQLQSFTVNNKKYNVYSLTFAYRYFSNNKIRYKLYSPLKRERRFFFSNIEGIDTWLFNNNSDTLFICKSAKDQLVISNLLKSKYDYCHVQGEGQTPNWDFLHNYKHFIIFYDNDKPGIEGLFKMTEFIAEKCFKTLESIQSIILPSVEKDATEYQLKHGKAKLFKIITSII